MTPITDNSAGRVEWPAVPPGFRWKVKSYIDDGWGDDHGIRVCLQARAKLGFWYTYYSSVVSKQKNKDIYECTSQTAHSVLVLAQKKAREQTTRSDLIGVHKQDSY